MKKYIIPIIIILSILISGYSAIWFGTGRGHKTYSDEWIYRRLHPEFLPSAQMVELVDMGHSTSYASFKWLQLVQFIGDNIGDNRFLSFTHTILEHISSLHPYFSKVYETDLIFAPTSRGENMTPSEQQKNEKYIRDAIRLGKKGMNSICDTQKIEAIKKLDTTQSLWDRTDLKNPCSNGMLPYYLGFVIYQTGKQKTEASEYYKIASMNDDAPTASKLLSVSSKAAEGDHLASAENFLLIGRSGYDIEPFECQRVSKTLYESLAREGRVTQRLYDTLGYIDENIPVTHDEKIPASLGNTNCREILTRGIKELYLSYITDISKNREAKTIDDIVKTGLLKTAPTIHENKDLTPILVNGIWQWREKPTPPAPKQ